MRYILSFGFLPFTVELLNGRSDKVFLMHGLLDANVLYEHSKLLFDAFCENNKYASLQIYPTEGHGLRERRNIEHADVLIFTWLLKNL